jgi:hypothetical protein
MQSETDSDSGDGGYFRGEYYPESVMEMVRLAQTTRADLQKNWDAILARGEDPKTFEAQLDALEDQIEEKCRPAREAEEALLLAHVEEAQAVRDVAMTFCRLHLANQRDHLERLANYPADERPSLLEVSGQIQSHAIDCHSLLSTEDRETLRQEGWRDEWIRTP